MDTLKKGPLQGIFLVYNEYEYGKRDELNEQNQVY